MQTAFAQTAQDKPAPDAPRPWDVCNETSYILNVAAMTTPIGGDVSLARVRGWTKLRPGQCEPVKAEPGTPRFVYARSDSVHQGPVQEWKGQHTYCVDDKDFTATLELSCALQNLQEAEFLRVVPTEEKTRFVEPADYKSKAVTAGLQRLLRDNLYPVTRIDGLDGRRTSNSLNKFLKDNALARSISLEAKFEALEAAARKRAETVGVQFCNQTKTKLWAAIAYDDGDWWKSVGWWTVEPDACVRPFNQNLKLVDVYVHARQEVPDNPDKVLFISDDDTTARAFCVAQSKFSAITHEYCSDQGYATARFKALGREDSGQTLTLTDADFNKPLVDGLR